MVEAMEEARVEASSRCSSSQTQQLLAEDSSRTVRRMTKVDGTVCDLGHAQDRGGDGASSSRFQQVSRSDQGWRRCLPSGTSAAMSARERLEAWRWIECLLNEDRRRGAPPPEKAMTPVGWLDHERRCCSLEGATTTSSFGRVDDGSKMNGRATQTR